MVPMKSKQTPTDAVLDLLRGGTRVFLTGGAGVGKSHTTREVIRRLGHVVVLGSTGLAAAAIGGETVHRFFGFGICKNLEELRAMKRSKPYPWLRELFEREIKLIVIDEVSMISSDLFDMIGYRLEQLHYTGGLMVVGDFLQLPPVGEAERYAFESDYWRSCDFRMIELHRNYRTKDRAFGDLLNRLRLGEMPEERTLIESMVSRFVDRERATWLGGTNAQAHARNAQKLRSLGRPLVSLPWETLLEAPEYAAEFEAFKRAINLESELVLCEGALVIISTNDVEKGLFNGQKGMVTHIDPAQGSISVRVLPEEREVTIVPKSYEKMHYVPAEIDGKATLDAKKVGAILQYPLKPAYALTIHKSQGMGLEDLMVDLSRIFAPSQAYVALSRAINPDNVGLSGIRKEQLAAKFFADPRAIAFYANNGVYYRPGEQIPLF